MLLVDILQSLRLAISELIKSAAQFYLLYAFAAGVLIFALPAVKRTNYGENINPERFFGEGEGPDKVVLLDDPALAALARHDLIVNAQHTIDVAYYSVQKDYSAGAFFGALFEAADRGVRVRILLDGMFHGMKGPLRAVRYAICHHENMELKFYEPFDLLRPWTWQNRLHDKYIIADNKWGIIGGRNIGLRYFDPNSHRPVMDRDVLIINAQDSSSSAVCQLKDYFEDQWNSTYTKPARAPLRTAAQRLIAWGRERTDKIINEVRAQAETVFDKKFDWKSLAVPTRKVTLIHNPITRFKKEPWILMELGSLVKNAQQRIVMQSPYVIPTRSMRRYLLDARPRAETILLTNHPASPSNTNIFAVSGYLNNLPVTAASVHKLYEHYGNGSLHAKSFVFDRTLSLVGSFNLDARSAFLSTESMIVVHSPEFAQILEDQIGQIIAASAEKPTMASLRGLVITLLRIILWPFSYLL